LPEELITAEALAEYLKVPLGTVYRWNYAGTGPKRIRIGRFIRYRPADVEQWLEQRSGAK